MTSAKQLLPWYDRHARELPWRVGPRDRANGVVPDPYRVWLSEVMLQQTTVAAVKDYFGKFTGVWPAVADLAAASEEDVMKAWAGLGYYSRARNLKKCANQLVAEHGGVFPDTREALQSLPGVGDYTSAAIAAIAFNRPEAVVDGNVERVVTRLFAIKTPLPAAKTAVKLRVSQMLDPARPGDFAQAMMDLGATICTPKRPACLHCPLNEECQALSDPALDPEMFPVKMPKKAKPRRTGAAFVAVDRSGAILLERRPPKGLLGGMTQVPTTSWSSRENGEIDAKSAPFASKWMKTGSISHVFTHFELELIVWRADVFAQAIEQADGQWWSPPGTLSGEALPTVMKKVIACAVPDSL